ncbi:MAG: sigma-70 family RNA polymerase sigma factor, partial [Acidimicrobiales bacterium]
MDGPEEPRGPEQVAATGPPGPDGGAGADRALVEAYRSGHAGAFDAIFVKNYKRLLAQARRRLGSTAEAEDAVQETFERALRAMPTFGRRGEFRLGAWLSRILANVCHDRAARSAAEQRCAERVELSGPDRLEEPDAADVVVARGMAARLGEVLGELPASQRQAFVLRAVEGMEYGEVATEQGISEDNARARVHRARVALRRRLSGIGSGLSAVFAPLGAMAGNRVHRLHRRGDSPALPPPALPGQAAAGAASQPVGGAIGQVGQVVTQVASQPLAQAALVSVGSSRSSVLVGIVAAVATVSAGSQVLASAPPPAQGVLVASVPAAPPGPAGGGDATSLPDPATGPGHVSSGGVPAAPVPAGVLPAPDPATPATLATTPAASPTLPALGPGPADQAWIGQALALSVGWTPPAPSLAGLWPNCAAANVALTDASSTSVAASSAGDATPPPPSDPSPAAVTAAPIPDPVAAGLLAVGNVAIVAGGAQAVVQDESASLVPAGAGAGGAPATIHGQACLAGSTPTLSAVIDAGGYPAVSLYGLQVAAVANPAGHFWLWRGVTSYKAPAGSPGSALTSQFVAELSQAAGAGRAQLRLAFLAPGPPPASPGASTPTGTVPPSLAP